MKICVCSDSHGNKHGIRIMLEQEQPDALLFCGDGLDDLKGQKLPGKWAAVKGNCDYFCSEPDLYQDNWAGVELLMVHGHRYSVKRTEDIYLSEAFGRGAKVALYGHTHYQKASWHAGVLLLNPGTMSRYNEYYAVLTFENGMCTDCQLKRLMPRFGDEVLREL
ncbi:MAG: YfcE family phosphodiesterase [Clostridia bacterium]|nr:YfcE family phosphodiesterase [Clostridia bacterium]MBQ9925079.1 YfcE family phosphodiesterase [Clostridia bacterium]